MVVKYGRVIDGVRQSVSANGQVIGDIVSMKNGNKRFYTMTTHLPNQIVSDLGKFEEQVERAFSFLEK